MERNQFYREVLDSPDFRQAVAEATERGDLLWNWSRGAERGTTSWTSETA